MNWNEVSFDREGHNHTNVNNFGRGDDHMKLTEMYSSLPPTYINTNSALNYLIGKEISLNILPST